MSNESKRMLCWLALLAVIIGLCQAKVIENREDRRRQLQWQRLMAAYGEESRIEATRIAELVRSLHSRDDARQFFDRELTEGKAVWRLEESIYETVRWTHPRYGIEVELNFHGNQLVGSGINSGTAHLEEMHPRPPDISTTSRLESMRRPVPALAGLLWLGCLAITLFSKRYGRIAAEGMVVLSLLAGAAWLADPSYSLTWQGVFSNDHLFFAIVMYLPSVALLAWRQPRRERGLRFNLAALLALVTVTAVLLALGALGYLAIVVFAVGAGVFFVALAFWNRIALVTQGSRES